MPKDEVTLAQVLEAVKNGFTAIENKMATKDELNKVITMVGSLQGQISSMETDIKAIKGDVRDVHKRIDHVKKLSATKVSYAEFNDRLQPIKQSSTFPAHNNYPASPPM